MSGSQSRKPIGGRAKSLCIRNCVREYGALWLVKTPPSDWSELTFAIQNYGCRLFQNRCRLFTISKRQHRTFYCIVVRFQIIIMAFHIPLFVRNCNFREESTLKRPRVTKPVPGVSLEKPIWFSVRSDPFTLYCIIWEPIVLSCPYLLQTRF